MIVVIAATYLAFMTALVMAVYTHKLFNTRSNGHALVFMILISIGGTLEVLWFVPTIVRYFTA